MRVQFNANTYVVEPIYRDDGLGLRDVAAPAALAAAALELRAEAVRTTEQEPRADVDRRHDEAEGDSTAAGRARAAPPDDRGFIVATYPEWDRAAAVERPDWVTVRDVAPALGDKRPIEDALDAEPSVRLRIDRLVRGARIGRHERLKRRPDGPELDLDAALDPAISLGTGEIPDGRMSRESLLRTADLAVIIWLSISQSTRDAVAAQGHTEV